MISQILFSRAAMAFTIVFACVLLWAFLTPVAMLPHVPEISDYIRHIVIFAVLLIPLGTAMPEYRVKYALLKLLFGTAIEFAQPHFGRGFEIHDLISNALGVGAGWYASRRISTLMQFK